MKVSTKGRYGTRAVLDLALRYGNGPVQVREIAERQDISERYLENILNSLRKHGIVASVRGANGGYRLARHPERITVGEVVRALEGPLDVAECTGDGSCVRSAHCATRHIWNSLKQLIEKELDSITLRDLVEKDREMGKQQAVEYYI